MSAKGTLLQAVGGKGLNVQQYSKKRINENKNKANVDDILGIWQVVDEGGLVDQLPTYCSAVTTRIPVIEDELSDTAFMRMTISDLRDQVRELRTQVAELRTMISDGHLTNSTDANYVKRQLNQITSTFCRSDSHHPVPRLDSATLSNTDNVTDVTDNSRSTDPPEPLSDLQPIPSEEHDEDIVESCNQPHSFSDTVKTTPPEDFQVVQRKKNRGPPRKRIAVGRSIDSTVTFKGVAKKAVFCINRLEPETTTETVSLFSRNNGILVISCYLVKPPDASASSENTDPPRFIRMRVCMPHSDTEKNPIRRILSPSSRG